MKTAEELQAEVYSLRDHFYKHASYWHGRYCEEYARANRLQRRVKELAAERDKLSYQLARYSK